MKAVWMSSLLAAVALTRGAIPARAESLERRVERMERELNELKAEIRRRDAADRQRASDEGKRPRAEAAPASGSPRTATAPPPAAPTGAAGKPAPVATAQTRPERAETPMPTTQVPYIDRLRMGGYGSMRYSVTDNPSMKNTFELRRFVLTADANIAPRLKAYAELEFERFRKLEIEKNLTPSEGGLSAEPSVEGTNESEISLEQLWMQYDIQDWLRFSGGGALVQRGRFHIHQNRN